LSKDQKYCFGQPGPEIYREPGRSEPRLVPIPGEMEPTLAEYVLSLFHEYRRRPSDEALKKYPMWPVEQEVYDFFWSKVAQRGGSHSIRTISGTRDGTISVSRHSDGSALIWLHLLNGFHTVVPEAFMLKEDGCLDLRCEAEQWIDWLPSSHEIYVRSYEPPGSEPPTSDNPVAMYPWCFDLTPTSPEEFRAIKAFAQDVFTMLRQVERIPEERSIGVYITARSLRRNGETVPPHLGITVEDSCQLGDELTDRWGRILGDAMSHPSFPVSRIGQISQNTTGRDNRADAGPGLFQANELKWFHSSDIEREHTAHEIIASLARLQAIGIPIQTACSNHRKDPVWA